MTNQELIDKSLYELAVLDSGDSATANDSADMLDILNGMMAMWALSDKDLQWPPQDTLSDTAPLPRWAEQGVIANLAVEAAPTFQMKVTPELIRKADLGAAAIARILINEKLEGADMSHLPLGRNSRWNIETDT